MKRFLSVSLLLVLTALLLTGCFVGQKAIQNLEIKGLKTEYEIGETPDFSGVTATVVYNDNSTKEVDGSELSFGPLDTSAAGKKNLEITYDGFTVSIQITVKDKSIDAGIREISGIEYFSGIPAKVFVGDTISFDQLRIIVNYSDGTEETKDIATNANIKHNGDNIDTSKAGTQILTITFMGKSVDVDIVVNEIVLTGIEIDGDTVDTTITEGTDFDPTGMIVYAVYNNGAKLRVNLDDLSIVQDGTKVTISYQGKSAELTLSTEPPVVTSMTITTTGYEGNKLILGDKINTAGVTATAARNNGTSISIANSDLLFDIPEITEAGNYTITVTYKIDETIKAEYEISVLGIDKIVINTESVEISVPAGEEYDTSKLSVIITCSDGSKVDRYIADGVTVDLSNLDVENVNNSSVITASYGGVVSEKLSIVVHDPETNYFILDVEMPASLSALESKKNQFLNKGYAYVVGDDNPFIFKLDLTIINDAGTPIEGYSQYVSHFDIYLDGTLLEGAALDQYAVIDGKSNSVDFTDAAIGKTFTIKTRPLYGVDGRETDMTREITVTVVDGYNIYEAWELNYLTNYDGFDFKGDAGIDQTQTQIVDAFLATKGATRPQNLEGIILHNDLRIRTTDIPAEYFLGKDRGNEFWDVLTIFHHINDSASKSFSFYGNYYTIFSYDLPNVCADGTGNQTDGVSNGQLFRFTAPTPAGKNHNYKDYTLNINNLYMRDNDPNSDNEMTMYRDMRGLIAMKVVYQEVNMENVRVEAFFTSLLADGDYTVVNLNECKFFNAWSTHIYLWSCNEIQDGSDEAPVENYTPVTLNVTNSEITKCGGPVIIVQNKYAEYNSGSKSGAQVNIDNNTEIWTYVTGQEAWFKAMYATGTAQQIAQLGYALQGTLGTTYITDTNESGVPSSGTVYMNLILATIPAGSDFEAVMGSTHDLDGKVTISGTTYLDMTDTNTAPLLDASFNPTGQFVGYGDKNVATLVGTTGGAAPVFNSAVGGVGYFDGTALQTALTGDATTDAMNKAGLAMGDYISLYMGNMGILLGYGHTIAMPSAE